VSEKVIGTVFNGITDRTTVFWLGDLKELTVDKGF
jgi:hypothetical protein